MVIAEFYLIQLHINILFLASILLMEKFIVFIRAKFNKDLSSLIILGDVGGVVVSN